MADKKVYCFCGSNCRYETLTKEQILSAITQAVSTGTIQDVDAGFVTKIVEKNTGAALSFWLGTSHEYAKLTAEEKANCFCILTDDTSISDVQKMYDLINKSVAENTQRIGEIADFVVSKGKSDGWTFRKWQSGVAECWGKFNHTVAITKEITNDLLLNKYYRSDIVSETLPAGLFKEITDVNVTDVRTAEDAIYLSRVNEITNSVVKYIFMRAGQQSTTATFDVYIMIKGTWK